MESQKIANKYSTYRCVHKISHVQIQRQKQFERNFRSGSSADLGRDQTKKESPYITLKIVVKSQGKREKKKKRTMKKKKKKKPQNPLNQQIK